MKRTSSSCCCARLASHGPRELEASLRDTADSRAFAHQASRISGSQGRTTWTSCCKCRTASHRPTKRPMCSLRSAPPAPVRPLRWSRFLQSALISPRPHMQPCSRQGRARVYAHENCASVIKYVSRPDALILVCRKPSSAHGLNLMQIKHMGR